MPTDFFPQEYSDNERKEVTMPIPNQAWYSDAIYHVMNRGVRQLPIFLDQRDFQKFLTILDDTLHYSPFELHAFCLMTNHYHLMIGTKSEPLSKIIHAINDTYARWFNLKYEFNGSIFEKYYSSQPMTSDYGFMITSAYIHNNPRSTGIHPINYPWSSYQYYIFPEVTIQNCIHPVKSYRGIDGNEILQLYANPSHWHSYTHESSSSQTPPLAFTKERHQQLFPIPLHLHYEKYLEKEWKLTQIQRKIKE